MNNLFLILVILVTTIFLIAFVTIFHNLWTIYHQTENTVRHLGKKHHVQ